MFWKVYFWVLIVLSIIGYAMEGLGGTWGVVDLIVTAGGLLALFAYAYKKRIFVATAWKAYLPLLILWDLAYGLVIRPEVVGKPADINTLLGWVFVIPVYLAVYLYAFKFMAEPAPSQAEAPATSGARLWKPAKWMYGLALLIVIVGGLDFTAFISQKYSNVAEGLSDSTALMALAAWWAVAGGIAAVTYLRRRNADQPAHAAVPAGNTEAVARVTRENTERIAQETTEGTMPETTVRTTPMQQESQAQVTDRRSTEGRKRPYEALRALAKIYTVLAPLVLIIMILAGFGNLASAAPLPAKLGASFAFLIMGGIYYLLMRAMAQAIYLLFDIAGNVSRLAELANK